MSALYFDAGPEGSGKVMLATTVYENPSANYTFAMACSREALHKEGIPTAYLLLTGNCHVDDARNCVVRNFLESDCSDLVFLDADVSWEPEALITLCKADCDVVGGVYPYRRHGEDRMPVRPVANAEIRDDLIEVEGLPTGFLRIRKHVLERMAKASPKVSLDRKGPMPLIFERDIHGDERRGGDIRFCMRWRDMGGKIYALPELRLSHAGKMVACDSFGAHLRRKMGTTFEHMATRIKAGDITLDLFGEARKALSNPFSATEDVILTATHAARKADGPILEIGSGLTTIAMAAATDQTVWCVEHDPAWAERVEQMAAQAKTTNIALCTAPIKDGWYDAEEMVGLPESFSLCLLDGPPRQLASRMPFFERFGLKCSTIVVDDMDDPGYRRAVEKWCEQNGRKIGYVEPRCGVIQ